MDYGCPPQDSPTPEIFVGEANPAEARFYARMPWDAESSPVLVGIVSGPSCRYARTLPARVALVDQGPGSSLLAQAIVPDPCFWTPDLPFLYDVEVQLRPGSRYTMPLPLARRTVGIRPLGVRGNRLVLEGKTWVLRGAQVASVGDFPLAAWHDAGAAMLVADPTDELCNEASRVGVLLLAELSCPTDRLPAELRRLSDHAAVGFAILPYDTIADDDLRQAARSLILVQMAAIESPQSTAPWAQVVICPAGDLDAACRFADACRLPIIACRKLDDPATVQDARLACDRLQRDLAGRGDFAGYIV